MSESRIFVFGSNLRGRHGAGAAKFARLNRGALYHQRIGLQGQSYAIPTLNGNLNKLQFEQIKHYVRNFQIFAASIPNLSFQVTPISTGIAGFTHDQIAPMFNKSPLNCDLPDEWACFDLQKAPLTFFTKLATVFQALP